MNPKSLRTTVDIPAPLYRQLKEQAAVTGIPVRKLVLDGIRTILPAQRRSHQKKVRFPLIKSKGAKVDLTNEHIYEYVEFP